MRRQFRLKDDIEPSSRLNHIVKAINRPIFLPTQRKIILSILSKDDSWTLFVRNARSFESTTLEDIARRVARECCGLPFALITVARALGDKDLVEWKRAAQRLEKSQAANPDDYGEASTCIKLSYDYLKDEDYKSYFLLCFLFPEDYDIPIEDLFRYTIGKGLFRDADTLKETRERADSVVTHLIHSCLLLDGRNNIFVRMHDVVRDTAIQIAHSEDGHGFLVKAGCGLENWPHQLHEDYSAISLMANYIHKLPEKLVCPKLRILLPNYNSSIEEIPETFFQSPNILAVLDLSRTSISLLPRSFSPLTNLQALYLDHCSRLIDISILGKLEKLEILSMRNSCLKEWPREIGGLSNLKMLDITGESINTIPSKVISKLHNLEELYIEGFWNWGSKVVGDGEEINAGFDEVTSLSNLRVLEVCVSDSECIPKDVEFYPNWVKFNICIKTTANVEGTDQHAYNSITLKIDTISSFPDWLCNVVMTIVEMLYWVGCRWFIDSFVEYEHGRLHELKLLFVYGADSSERISTKTWVPKEHVFINLEKLYLIFVDCRDVCVGELPPGSLYNLRLLHVESCYNWGNVLLPSRSLQRLPNLE